MLFRISLGVDPPGGKLDSSQRSRFRPLKFVPEDDTSIKMPLYNIKENSTLAMKGFNSLKITESPVANSPHGKILALGVLALTDVDLKVCEMQVSAKPGRLILIKTVDVIPEVCNNSILNSSAYSDDVWICTFKFAEQPRELI